MGWNAGAFGAMTFPSTDALAAWQASTVSRDTWDDWFDDLEGGYRKDEPVAKRLAVIAKGNDPGKYLIQEITIDGPRVALAWDTHEDGFRDEAGDFAALMRGGAAHGAKGEFHFLGTAGAEGDFAYRLALDGKGGSTVKALDAAPLAKLYAGAPYKAHMAHLFALVEAHNPRVRAMAEKTRKGVAASAGGGDLHARVMAALAAVDDKALLAAAQGFPHNLPDGTKRIKAKQLFAKATAVRAQLAGAPNEDLRGAALWIAGELAPAAAVPLALEALTAAPAVSDEVRQAALRVLAHADAAHADAALAQIIRAFVEPAPKLGATQDAGHALRALVHPGLVAALATALKALGACGKPSSLTSVIFVVAIRDRETAGDKALRELAPALATYARSKADTAPRRAAAGLVLAWGDRASVAALAPNLGEEYGIGVEAALAQLAVDPAAALAIAAPIAAMKTANAARDRKLYNLFRALDDDRGSAALAAAEAAWLDIAIATFAHVGKRSDPYLPHNALDVIAKLATPKQKARALAAVEKEFAGDRWELHSLVEPMVELGSTKWRKLVKAKMAELAKLPATDTLSERDLLAACLEHYK